MSVPIQYTNISTQMPYCTVQDVLNLIGSVLPIANGTYQTSIIQQNIDAAARYIDKAAGRSFYPRRIVKQVDGNGESRIIVGDRPLMNVNQVSVYFVQPYNLTRVAYDYQLLVDKTSISFPIVYGNPIFAPFGFYFVRGTRNITLDIQTGYTQDYFNQPLATVDNQTYTFPASSIVNKTISTAPDQSQPPMISPIIYKNGVQLFNTQYTFVTIPESTTDEWQISQDNIYYTVNSNGAGINSITFNTPNLSSDIITADFTEAYVPEDIAEATMKRAAIICLTSMSLSWYGNEFDGIDKLQSENTRVEVHPDFGRFGHQIQIWQQDIKDIISANKKFIMGSNGQGYSDFNTQGIFG